jgi:hypothetical protein
MDDNTSLCIGVMFFMAMPVLIILAITYMNYKLTNNAFEKFACHSGLHFSPGNYLGVSDIKPFVSGNYNGFDLKLSIFDVLSGKNKTSYTRIEMTLPEETENYYLTISSYGIAKFVSGFFSLIGTDTGVSSEELKTGAREFDSSFRLTGCSDLIPIFTPELERSLFMIRDRVNFKVESKKITYENSGVIRDSSLLIQINEIMCYMAQKIVVLASYSHKNGISEEPHKEKYEIEEKPYSHGKMAQVSSYGVSLSEVKYNHNISREKPYETVGSDFVSYSYETPPPVARPSEDDKICSSCGTKVPPNNLYCIDCGRKLE